MNLFSETIKFPYETIKKRRVIFFSKPKYFMNHLKDHFTKKSERWSNFIKVDSNLIGNARKHFDKKKQFIMKNSDIQELYDTFQRYIMKDIKWASEFPLYILSSEKVFKIKNANEVSYNRVVICFLSPRGYRIFAHDMMLNNKTRSNDIAVRSSYFPVKVNPKQSSYKTFTESWSMTKEKYAQSVSIDSKYNARNEIKFRRYISEDHWKEIPSKKKLPIE